MYGLPNAPNKKSKAMKRIGNLYEQIISVENLRLADEKARREKTRSYGVRVHDRNREANIQALHEALLTKTFRTSPYEVFTIYEPKERVIYRLPYYPDRIVHHAIMNVLEPIWVKTFTYNTYSCVKGRGIEGCARHVDKMIRKYRGKPVYCLKIDIKKYYPSIKHHVLKRIVRRKIKDKDLLWLLDYVGYKFYRKQKLIRKSIKQNFCRAAARLNKRNPPLDVKAYKQAVAPWLGWAKHSNSKHLLQTIIKKEYYDSIL